MFHSNTPMPFLLALVIVFFSQPAFSKDSLLDQAIANKQRTADFIKRDQYRHPKETLEFFGIKPNMTVVEIWPGGGWYSEILAPYLKKKGLYYAAGFSLTAKRTPKWRKEYAQKLIDKFKAKPEMYSKAIISSLAIPEDINLAPVCSADMVLTFRNTHNWVRGDYTFEAFQAIADTLKQGGTLGLVQHRADKDTDIKTIKETGYVSEDFIIRLAKKVGLELIEKSEINANPKDSKNHPKGVWTLPPSLRLGDKDKEKYLAIGESDRMTLKFRKKATCAE